jgi:hypothetical protein
MKPEFWNPGPNTLGLHMSDLVTCHDTPNKETWLRPEKGGLLHSMGMHKKTACQFIFKIRCKLWVSIDKELGQGEKGMYIFKQSWSQVCSSGSLSQSLFGEKLWRSSYHQSWGDSHVPFL